jgi:integrase
MQLMYMYRRNGIYWFQGPVRMGVRPRPRSLGTRDLDVALKLRQEILSGECAVGGNMMGAIEGFLVARRAQGRHVQKSQQNYRGVLGLFARFAGDVDLAAVDAELINAWKGALLAAGRSRATVTNYLTHLRAFLNWAKGEGLIRAVVIDGKAVTVPASRASRAREFYTKGQRDALIRFAAATGRRDLEWVLYLGLHCGMRYREIVEARGCWFVRSGDRWRVEVQASADYGLKWHKERVIPCNRAVCEFLDAAGAGGGDGFVVAPAITRGKGEWRWDARKQWVRAHCGVVARVYGFHSMRHTFASLHVQAGTGLALVAQWLGVDIRVAYQHYARYAPGGEAVDNAV